MNRSESISQFAAAFVKAQASMDNAVKGAANPFFKSKFADLNSIREACTPPLNACGISILQPTTVVDGKHYIETILLHESGEFLSGLYEIVVAKANDPQSLGAAISYARRYGLQSMVSLGAEDDDGESALGRKASAGGNFAKPTPSVTKTTPPVTDYYQAGDPPAKKTGGFGAKKTETPAAAKVEDGWS